MKVSTIFAILVCALLPLISYFIVKNYTDSHVKLPRKYFYDYVKEDTVDGKKRTDTFWHKVKNLKMVNQYGDTVQLDSLRGKVILFNFFFTHCPTICPTMTKNLRRVQNAIKKDSSIFMISLTMDPKRDTVKTLRDYALKNDIHQDNWWLCRLVNDTLEKVMFKEFKAGFQTDSVVEIIHSPDVYLLDRKRVIRGKTAPPVITPENPNGSRFYNATDTADLIQLIEDAGLVKLEKIEKGKPPFFILIASMVIMGGVFVWLLFVYRKKKKLIPGGR
jgi:protein SCO1